MGCSTSCADIGNGAPISSEELAHRTGFARGAIERAPEIGQILLLDDATRKEPAQDALESYFEMYRTGSSR